MRDIDWLEDFHETCRDIQEDTLLLEALSAYTEGRLENEGFSHVLKRLSDYLAQHTADLRCLEKRLERTLQ